MKATEMAKLREMLGSYERENGCVELTPAETLNCYCGANCTAACSRYADGRGGGVCWQSVNR